MGAALSLSVLAVESEQMAGTGCWSRGMGFGTEGWNWALRFGTLKLIAGN